MSWEGLENALYVLCDRGNLEEKKKAAIGNETRIDQPARRREVAQIGGKMTKIENKG